MKNMPTAFLMILVYCLSGRTSDEGRIQNFFSNTETLLKIQYRECTGDSDIKDTKKILEWSERLAKWQKNREYLETIQEYKRIYGTKDSVKPCELMEWASRRKMVQDSSENILIKNIIEKNEAEEAAHEIALHKASAFDFENIPFGISKSAVAYNFNKRFGIELKKKNDFLYADNFLIGDVSFLAAFFFDDAGYIYKYEIEGKSMPADSLDIGVRRDARLLSMMFKKKAGPPTHSFRIGFFDIKSKELSILDKWETAERSAYSGIAAIHYRYYAKMIVTDLTHGKQKNVKK
jgi:hypothetical protein